MGFLNRKKPVQPLEQSMTDGEQLPEFQEEQQITESYDLPKEPPARLMPKAKPVSQVPRVPEIQQSTVDSLIETIKQFEEVLREHEGRITRIESKFFRASP